MLLILFSELSYLDNKENILDQLVEHCTKQLKHLTENQENSKYPYLAATKSFTFQGFLICLSLQLIFM